MIVPSSRRALPRSLVTRIAAMLVVVVALVAGSLAPVAGTMAGARLAGEPTYTSTALPGPEHSGARSQREPEPRFHLRLPDGAGESRQPRRAHDPHRGCPRAGDDGDAAPGSHCLFDRRTRGIAFLDALAAVASGMNADREVIFVDQRGTYHSDPFLACPEYDKYLDDSLSLHFSDPATGKLDEASVRECRDRLAQSGVDFSAYNSAENAADIADLRVALGIAEWNVYGVSYGTDLAQWLLRDHPEGIRSVVLDSVVPIDQNIIEEWWPAAAMGYRAIFDACAAQPACASAYPDLEAEFTATVNRLNDEPLVVETTNAAGEPTVVNIDGYTVANLIVQQSYVGESGFASVPSMIHELANGDGHAAATSLLSRTSPPGLVGYGLAFGAYCREMVALTTPEEVTARAKEVLPDFPDEVLQFLPVAGRAFEDCAIWDAGAAAADELGPVQSDVPVLILGGTFDMVTPFAWGEIVAKGLENAQVVAIPGGGHGLVNTMPCAQELMTAFIDNPDAPVDATCATELTLPMFTTP